MQNRLQGKNSNKYLILASANIRSYKCECCFETPEVEWTNVTPVFMGMVAQVICEQNIHHQKLASGGKGTAKLSSWSKTMKHSKAAVGFNRVLTFN